MDVVFPRVRNPTHLLGWGFFLNMKVALATAFNERLPGTDNLELRFSLTTSDGVALSIRVRQG